ncbi:hypothetical protein [Spirillospora sp. CA-128828]|uniref:hypothetical protein n=1 Tax=Spirillospora sp. CA-128828 TaxID=3240033 RepID=UPI003D8F3842
MTAVYAAPAALLATAVIAIAVREGQAVLAHLLDDATTPAGYDPDGDAPAPGIRVNPGREPW